jgi:hypothetical protein
MRRAVSAGNAQRAAARRDLLHAETQRRRAELGLAQNRGERVRAGERAMSAGRLATRESFERVLDERVAASRLAEKRAQVQLDRAERALADAQRALADAVLARQRSEAMQAAERTATARDKERRENSEAEDRYRPRGFLDGRGRRR